MAKQTFLSKLALAASFFALGVIALGAFTRLIDAGLGCPDWPGCYGHWVPDLQSPLVAYKAWAEMIHRYFVSGLGLLIIGVIITIFQKKYRTYPNVIFAGCLVLLLIYQISLGRWTVTLKLLPAIVTQHLLGGFLILSTLWLIYLNNRINIIRSLLKADQKTWFLSFSIMALILLLLQISLGAWTSTNYASLSCADFPFCNNDQPMMTLYFKEAFNLFSPIGINYEHGVLPTVIRQTIQMSHRLGALIFTLYIFIFSAVAMHKLKNSPELLKSFYLILGLLTIQLCIGIANIIFKLPLISAMGHNLMAVLLLLSVITLIFKFKVAAT